MLYIFVIRVIIAMKKMLVKGSKNPEFHALMYSLLLNSGVMVMDMKIAKKHLLPV